MITKIYDNGGDTADRYTVFTDQHEGQYYEALCVNDMPTHPSYGFSQFSFGAPGEHLGKEISFDDLPDNVQAHVKQRLDLN